eukprot:1637781-Pyramimonas_sp.AAC.1
MASPDVAEGGAGVGGPLSCWHHLEEIQPAGNLQKRPAPHTTSQTSASLHTCKFGYRRLHLPYLRVGNIVRGL